MAASGKLRDEMYDQLLAISREAFREGSFEVAFHALCAAMHRAKDLKSVPFLRELLQEAEQQMQLIDTRYPDHPLSSSSAGSRTKQVEPAPWRNFNPLCLLYWASRSPRRGRPWLVPLMSYVRLPSRQDSQGGAVRRRSP